MFNPILKDEDYPLFKQQVDELRSLIDQAKEDAVSRNTVGEITHYVSIYNRLLFQKKRMIVVGGLAYDNSAAMDVLMDTVNAVNRSLTEGFTGGANTAFCSALLELKKEYSSYSKYKDKEDIRENKMIYFIMESFLEALKDIYKGIDWNINGYVQTKDPVTLVENSADRQVYLCYDSEHGWNIHNIWDAINQAEPYSDMASVIQPSELVPEVLTRIGEVCLKFLKTNNIISEDGVYTPPKKKTLWNRLFKR